MMFTTFFNKPPVHFLDATRQALSASVANQALEHFWSIYNLIRVAGCHVTCCCFLP